MTKVKRYLVGNQSCLLWGNNYDNPLSQLIRLQNKAVRIMNDFPLRYHITRSVLCLSTIVVNNVRKVLNFHLGVTFLPSPVSLLSFALFIAGETNIELGEGGIQPTV